MCQTNDDGSVLEKWQEKQLKDRLRWTPWVCWDCGVKYGRVQPRVATWHLGVCGVCGRTVAVTEPRDFGHLDLKNV